MLLWIPHQYCTACPSLPALLLQALRALEVEDAPLLPPTVTVSAGGRGGLQRGGGGGGHDAEPVDWIMTSLLFLFPAIGGALFG